MTDEPTRRLGSALQPAAESGEHSEQASAFDGGTVGGHFTRVSTQPSGYPEAFPDREGPTLASPNSEAISAQSSLEPRLARALDRIQQLETDVECLEAKVSQLDTVIEAERARGRAARLGRYLLWAAVIAALASFWMMLRQRLGMH